MRTLPAKKLFALTAAAASLVIFYILPVPSGLTKEAMGVFGIFAASLILWIGVAIDWPSLITILLVGFLPSFGFPAAFSGAFGNSTVAFLIFTFMLVYPLAKTSFVRRCTVAFITNRFARKGPWHFICFLFAAETLLGLFISPSVLFVAFMPFLEDIYRVLGLDKQSPTARMMMLGSVFVISLSSGMTPIGHVWPTLALGCYASATGQSISQFQYLMFGIPTGLAIIALMVLMFAFAYRPRDIRALDPAKALPLRGTVPPADAREKAVLATVALTVFLWIAPSLAKAWLPAFYKTVNSWTTALPPLVGCLILFLYPAADKPLLDFREVTAKGIMWGSILMTGAATLLGACLTKDTVGISAWLATALAPLASRLPAFGLVLFFIAWTVIETNFSSNIVTTTVVSTAALAVLPALSGAVNMAAVICLIGFGAAVCNMTPAGQSTINTVAIGSGWTDARAMFGWGALFALIAIAVMAFVGYPLASALM